MSEDRPYTFGGIRKVDGYTLVLLRGNEQMVVMPVDDNTARRLQRLSVGDAISVTPGGATKTRGRSR